MRSTRYAISPRTLRRTGRNGPLGDSLLETIVRQAFGPLEEHCLPGRVTVGTAEKRLLDRVVTNVCLPTATVFSGNPTDTRAPDGGTWNDRAYGDLSPHEHASWANITDEPPAREADPLDDFAPGQLWFANRETPSTIQRFKSLWESCGNLIHGYVRSAGAPQVRAYLVLRESQADAIGIRSVDSPLRYAPPIPDENAFLRELPATWKQASADDPEIAHGDLRETIDTKSRVLAYSEVYEVVGTNNFRRATYAFARPGGVETPIGKHMMVPMKKLAPGDVVLTFESPYDHVTFDFQRGLLERAGVGGRPVGSFGTSFPELAAFLKQYGDIDVPLDVLSVDVEREVLRGDGPVEILGLKIDRTSVASWGAAILVGIQLYFVSHLREWNRRKQSSSALLSVAWIGFYSGFLPRLVFLTSTIVLPSIAVVLVWRRAWTATDNFAEVASVLMSLGVLMTVWAVLKIRVRRSAAP